MVSTATRTAFTLFVLILTVCTGIAQSSKQGDEVLQRAEQLFEQERFAEAYPLFSQLVSLKPNDPNVNFKFGATSLYAGVAKEKAVKHISFALKKGCSDPRAWFYLGKAHHLNYDFAKAEDAYSKYLEKVSPKEKNPLPAQRNLQMCRQGGKLLSNIRDVVVLEKTEAAESDFFRYYNLEEIGGRVLRTPDELLTKYDKKNELVSVMHYPGDAVTIYFTSYGKDGSSGKDIYRASILPGGAYSTPERLPDVINTEFDEDFAFMHPDGKTFYFASRGHNSMGGYDIFKSTYDPVNDTFSKPENLDFAINTPDDDLFYVVDSLKQTAYFASGRSSAQGQLHVYKVMVQSKPVELMFIAGGYKPEAPGLDKKAKITITDELTGRPVLETIADATRGGYLLELPKAGMYRIDVLPTGGAVKHTGVFNVPVFDRSVALAQELRIVNEEGIEKLIITNSFDEPLDVNLAELAADALRRRSSLDVNVSDEALRELEKLKEQEPGSLREELNLDDLVVQAGFKAGTSPQAIVDRVAQQSADKQRQAANINSKAVALLNESASTTEKASAQLKKAQSLMENAEKQGPEAIAGVNDEYNKLIADADANAERASQLKEAARQLHLSSQTIQGQAEKQNLRADELQVAVNSGDLALAKAIFEEQYAFEQETESTALLAEENTNEALREADRLVNALTGRMESLEQERKELQGRKTILKRELEAASKKNQITQIKIELEQVETDLIAVDNEAYLKNQNLADAYRNRRQLNLRKELIAAALSTETPEESTEAFPEALLADLDAATNQINDRLNILRVDEGTTFGLGATAEAQKTTPLENAQTQSEQPMADAQTTSPKQVSTSQATDHSPELLQRAELAGIDFAPVSTRQENWSELNDLVIAEPSHASLRQQAIDNKQRKEVEELIAFLTPLTEDPSISEADREWAKKELTAAKVWQNELRETVQTSPTLVQASPEDVRATLNNQFPELAEALAGEKGNDLSALARRIEVFTEAEEATAKAIEALENQLVMASTEAEVTRVAEELIVLQNVQQRISAEALVDKAQVAWENDQRAIIEEDESFVVRTERQIELAETYIETLEKLRLRANTENAEARLAAIDSEIKRAGDKVAMQRAELELAVSVDDSVRTSTPNEEVELAFEPTEATQTSSAEQNTATIEPKDRRETQVDETKVAQSAVPREERIAALVDSIDTVEDEAERDRLQAELTVMLKEKDDAAVAPRIEVSLIPPPVAKTATNVVLKEQSTYVELADNRPDIRSAERKIDDAQKAVDLMNKQIESAQKRSDVKKFERQRDVAEKQGRDAKVERALAAEPVTSATYEENQKSIAQIWENTTVTDEARKRIGSHLAIEQRRAEQNFEAAQVLRAEAQKRRTSQERSDMLEEALVKEVEAIAIQNRVIAIAENAESLALAELSDLDGVLSGELRLENIILRDAEIVEQATDLAETLDNSDDKLAERAMPSGVEEQAGSSNDDDRAQSGIEQLDENVTTEALADDRTTEEGALTSAEDVSISDDAETAEEGELSTISQTEEELAASEAIIINLRKEMGLPEQLPQPAEPELAELALLGVEEEAALAVLLEEREVLIDARAAVVRAVEQTNVRIATMEEAIRAAETSAEKDGLAEELGALYRTAEVRYNELADYDRQLMEAEDNLVVRAAEVRSALAAGAVEDEVREGTADDVPGVGTPDERSAETVRTEDLPKEVELAAREEKRERAAKSDVVDYLFALPEVMIESVFEILDEHAYSEAKPIPVDIAMPEGIIYKVQVGAFRNPIAASTFDRFAPLAGERLNNGITRYTAGVFVEFNSADEAKQSIREMGYSDAFVVAYRNGQRISISDARNSEQTQSTLAEVAPVRSASSTDDRSVAPKQPAAATTPLPDTTPENAPEDVTLPEFAERWNTSKGAWLTVQIGVYSKPVTLTDLYNVTNVMAEVLDGGLVRYTTGKFESVESAGAAREAARNQGINDAFVTAYIDGRRVSIAEFRSYAQSEPATKEVSAEEVFRVQIGGFSGKVPAETARALLLLESKWGVFQRETAGETFYFTRTFSSADAAERAANEFKQRGATAVEVIAE